MYSQNDEERIILDYFIKNNIVQPWFLDLGANDGVTLSNTRKLYELGWKGILVDASPKAFAMLCDNYKQSGSDIILYNIALSDKSGFVDFNESGDLLKTGDVGLVSTFHEHEMERFKSIVDYQKISVPSKTWDEFINESPVGHFDFISMDIEGSEMTVLPFMDLSKCKMICIEWNGKEELKTEYEKYLSGFNLIHTNGENLIYAR